jgi:hypothetical protein
MIHRLVQPRPIRLTEPKVTIPHIAVGLWVATALVLLLPSPRQPRRRPEERDVLQAHGVIMAAFGLL